LSIEITTVGGTEIGVVLPSGRQPARSYPAELAIGTLIERRGCIFLRHTDGSVSLLI
jgi:hypothetical protein